MKKKSTEKVNLNAIKEAGDVGEDNRRLDKAIIYAVEHHAGQLRKGTSRPYIMHPLEAMQILHSMRADTNLMMAGVLHDTIEDTEATAEEIRELFGDDVADLVTAHSEDKSKTWIERKTNAIEHLAKADKRLKMLIMSDKVSNLRSMAFDYEQIGDALWDRFNAPLEKQAWYYSGIQDALYDMQNYPECAAIYWEMVGLFKDLFVKYYLDESAGAIYQCCPGVSANVLLMGNPQWFDVDATDSLDNAVQIDRLSAEQLEDEWGKAFWNTHERDMADGSYSVHSSKGHYVDFRIGSHKLTVACEDVGAGCSVMTGGDAYEYYYELDEEGTHRFLCRLRIEHGFVGALGNLLKEVFGTDDGTIRFTEFCKKNDIEYRLISM